MRLTPLTRAIGLTLARDLPPTGPNRIPLLRQGTVITPRFQAALGDHGIHAVWVDDPLSEGIEPVELLPEPVRIETAAKVASALDEARTAIGDSQRLAFDVLAELRDVVDLIAASITDSPDAALFLGDLAGADQYTHRHSVNVTALGLLLGRAYWRTEGWVDFQGRRRWDRIDERLAKLGMGLLLHDIGKMVVPSEVLNKPGKLDADEWALMQTHPEAGVALLDSATISPLVRSVVRDHHERWDGSGYPRGLVGRPDRRVPAPGRDRRRLRRDHEPAPLRARRAAARRRAGDHRTALGSAFDPGMVGVFRRLVMPFPVGTEITLPDGRIGVVAAADADQPDRPLVRVEGEELRVDMAEATASAAAAI